MHLYDRIEEYNFSHNLHFDSATGQYSILLPHDLNRPLTHDEMDYNLLYHKQTMNGYRIFGSSSDQSLDPTEDVDKVLKFHKIQQSDEDFANYTSAGYGEGQFIWIMVEMAAAAQPTYVTLTADPGTVNETSNASVVFTLNTVNVEDNTTVDWSISGTDITANDFLSGTLTGTATIVGNTASWTVTTNADHFTENNPEQFTLTLAATDSANNDTTTMSQDPQGNGGVPLSADVDITDTSFTPQYNSITSNSSVSEGQSITFNVNTSYFFQTADIDWEIDFNQSTATLADFTGPVSGTVQMSAGGVGSFTVSVASDVESDSGENFTVRLVGSDTNGIDGQNRSKTVSINSVAFPAYSSFAANTSTVTEGNSVTFTLTGNNLTSGRTVAYQITGLSNANDINVPLTGNITMSGTTGTLVIQASEDGTIESPETFTVELATSDDAGNSVGLDPALSDTCTIQDKGPVFDIRQSKSTIKEDPDNALEFEFNIYTHNVPIGDTVSYNIGGTWAANELEVVGVGQTSPASPTVLNMAGGVGYTGVATVEAFSGNQITSNGATATGLATVKIKPLFQKGGSTYSGFFRPTRSLTFGLASTSSSGISVTGSTQNVAPSITNANVAFNISSVPGNSSINETTNDLITWSGAVTVNNNQNKGATVFGGDTLYWEARNHQSSASSQVEWADDFVGGAGSRTGSVTVSNSGVIPSWTMQTVADNSTEGTESYKMFLWPDSSHYLSNGPVFYSSQNYANFPSSGSSQLYGDTISVSDSSQTPAALTYFFHLGAGAAPYNYPYNQDLTGSPLYVATTLAQSTSSPEFIDVFEDALANPNLYEPISTVQLVSGAQMVFPASVAQNYGWMLIPDSAGIPDLTQNALLFDPNGIPTPQLCPVKLAMIVQGAPHTLYRMPGSPTTGTFTLQYV